MLLISAPFRLASVIIALLTEARSNKVPDRLAPVKLVAMHSAPDRSVPDRSAPDTSAVLSAVWWNFAP